MDGVPVRVFRNHDANGVPYLSRQAMKVHATIWDGDTWATRGGRVKIDWAHAPFVASYRGYSADACVPAGAGRPLACPAGTGRWMRRRPSAAERGTVAWAKKNYMRYNYCEDGYRFPQGFPAECSRY